MRFQTGLDYSFLQTSEKERCECWNFVIWCWSVMILFKCHMSWSQSIRGWPTPSQACASGSYNGRLSSNHLVNHLFQRCYIVVPHRDWDINCLFYREGCRYIRICGIKNNPTLERSKIYSPIYDLHRDFTLGRMGSVVQRMEYRKHWVLIG